MKRATDIVLASIALLALALPMLLLAWQVRRRLGRPVLFRQLRPGLHGVPFEMVKFRTMTDARGPDGALLPDAQRMTAFGRFLRASSLDELPELWNVLRGEMSLVGPRPQIDREVALYDRAAARRLLVKPGLTGLWQVSGRSELAPDDAIRMDVYYVENWTLFGDLIILARTAKVMLTGEGAS